LGLEISQNIAAKLETKHLVSRAEVAQCFANRIGGLLIDTRENHVTDPPTKWFLSFTDKKRLLKVVFVAVGNDIYLKTAYEPEKEATEIYEDKFGLSFSRISTKH